MSDGFLHDVRYVMTNMHVSALFLIHNPRGQVLCLHSGEFPERDLRDIKLRFEWGVGFEESCLLHYPGGEGSFQPNPNVKPRSAASMNPGPDRR